MSSGGRSQSNDRPRDELGRFVSQDQDEGQQGGRSGGQQGGSSGRSGSQGRSGGQGGQGGQGRSGSQGGSGGRSQQGGSSQDQQNADPAYKSFMAANRSKLDDIDKLLGEEGN